MDKRERAGQGFACHIQTSVRSYREHPFCKGDAAAFDFQTGDAVRVYAASAVTVRKIRLRQGGAVGMPGNQENLFFFGKGLQPFFTGLLAGIIFSGAGGVENPVVLQWSPEVSDQEAGDRPEGGIKKVCLMSVGQVEILCIRGKQVFQNNSGIKGNVGQKGLLLFYHIMIAVEHIKASFPVKAAKLGKNVFMGLDNLLYTAVFPQLISVPQFDIGVSGMVIMLQGGKIEIAVFQEVVV